ncbi:MAG: signal peptidase [Actinomycetota bacterium]|jgi:signal peptidase II
MRLTPVSAALSIAGFVVLVDRISKIWAEANLVLGESEVVIANWLEFKLAYNPGAAFSFLSDATWLFTLFSTAATVFIVVNLSKLQHTGWAAAVGGVLGGAVGNLIDRLTQDPGFPVGHVIDFLHVPSIWLFQIFNLADASLTISVIALMIMSLRGFNMDGSRTIESKEIHE